MQRSALFVALIAAACAAPQTPTTTGNQVILATAIPTARVRTGALLQRCEGCRDEGAELWRVTLEQVAVLQGERLGSRVVAAALGDHFFIGENAPASPDGRHFFVLQRARGESFRASFVVAEAHPIVRDRFCTQLPLPEYLSGAAFMLEQQAAPALHCYSLRDAERLPCPACAVRAESAPE
ncbi:MAG: hypothetical protein FJ091_18410 [Deltaproteobacteria bacterium]|nr:hypothetical protein [Deltaproteobacteria bacterium]